MVKRPENTKAELALVKSILISPEIADKVFAKITGDMFYDETNRHVFQTLKRMRDDSVGIDEVTLKGYLNSTYERIGGDKYFDRINKLDAFPQNMPDYMNSIFDTYKLRVLIDAGLDIAETGLRIHDPTIVINKLLQYADVASNGLSHESSVLSLASLQDKQYEQFLYRCKNPGFTGLRTGILDYDLQLGGMNPADLILIAGRPSHGKTSYILTILRNMAKEGIPGGLYSYEQPPEQIFNRLLSMESGVPFTRIVSGRLDQDDIRRVEKAFKVISALPIFISYAPGMSIDEVVTSANKLTRSEGAKIFGLDYLQLMTDKSDNQNNELGYITRRLKLDAVRNKVIWVAASQLNRRVEYRENKRPLLSDLRDSGNLEQDADIVAMIYRDYNYNPKPDNENLAELLIRKNRNGPVTDLAIRFDKQSMVFYSEIN